VDDRSAFDSWLADHGVASQIHSSLASRSLIGVVRFDDCLENVVVVFSNVNDLVSMCSMIIRVDIRITPCAVEEAGRV
jgi:hypothetical protein